MMKQAHGWVQLEVVPITTIQAKTDSNLVKWQETNQLCCSDLDLKENRRTVVWFGLGMAVASLPEKTFPSTASACCRAPKRVELLLQILLPGRYHWPNWRRHLPSWARNSACVTAQLTSLMCTPPHIRVPPLQRKAQNVLPWSSWHTGALSLLIRHSQ